MIRVWRVLDLTARKDRGELKEKRPGRKEKKWRRRRVKLEENVTEEWMGARASP